MEVWQAFHKLKSEISITFLGTGTSTGVPVIGCSCKICRSEDPRLIRTRSSIHLQTPEFSILVDSGPDLREQALRENLTHVDAVLYTHAHVDHIAGFDELRAYCWKSDTPLPLYGSKSLLEHLKNMYRWAFLPTNQYKGYIKPDPIETNGAFQLGELTVTPIPVIHGSMHTQGYRFDYPDALSVAYIPDVKIIPAESMKLLQNIPCLIIDSLHQRQHPTHMNLSEALSVSKELNVQQVYLTHLSHELDVYEVAKELPNYAQFAYDGLKVHFPIAELI
ncbi:MAG: MBL fold metallo-hydrolase [Akkermansiaceae bacterium]